MDLSTSAVVVCRQYTSRYEAIAQLLDPYLYSPAAASLLKVAKLQSSRLLARIARSLPGDNTERLVRESDFNTAIVLSLRYGDVPLAMEIVAAFDNVLVAKAVSVAARLGMTRFLRWLHERSYNVCWGGCEMMEAARFQHIDTLAWLQESTTRLGPQHLLRLAVRHESCDLLRWVLSVRKEVATLNDLDCAARFGRLDCLKILSVHVASRHLVQFVSAEAAVRNGHLHVIQWLHDKSAHFSPATMDLAAKSGHLSIVRWLNDNRSEGCTVAAMDSAARYGHLTILRWLKRNRSEGCSRIAMLFAVLSKRLEVVQWVHQNYTLPCVGRLVDVAAKSAPLPLVEWLVRTYPSSYTSAALDNAARRSDKTVFDFLHGLGLSCTTRAMDNVAARGDLEMLEWLFEHRSEGCTAAAVDSAAAKGHLHVVRWLFDHGYTGTRRAMDAAARNEHYSGAAHLLFVHSLVVLASSVLLN